jgi:tetratricopeptide (TPR) repeat protein
MHAMWSVLVFLALQAWSQPAEQLWNAGKRVEAIEFLAASAKADPQDTQLRRRLAEAELEVHWYAAALQHAEGLGPQLDPLRALCLYRLGEFERALLLFSRAEPGALLRRIDCLEALARFEESDLELERLAALVGEQDARLPVPRARAAVRKGELEAAQHWYRRALESDPSDPAALFGLGRLLVQAGERGAGMQLLQEHRRVTVLLDALDFAQRAVDLAPVHASNHASVGDALRALGRSDAAELAYERAVALATVQELAPIALRHARLLVEDRHDPDKAVRLLDKSFERSRDVRLAVRAGDLLLEAQRMPEALARFEAAAALRPDDAQINQRLRQAKGQD